MARQAADDACLFRAVVVTMTSYPDGREPFERTTFFGPYRTAGVARGMIRRERERADRSNAHRERYPGIFGPGPHPYETVTGHVERAVTVWTAVD